MSGTSGTPSLVRSTDGLPDDLAPGRPRICLVPSQRMVELVAEADPPAVLAAVLDPLAAAARALWGERAAGPVDGRLRRRFWDVCGSQAASGRRVAFGLPVSADAAEGPVSGIPVLSPDFTVTVRTWEYGIVGCVLHAGRNGHVDRTVALLRRHVQEQGFGVAPDSYEEVCLGDPLHAAADERIALLLFRLRRFY